MLDKPISPLRQRMIDDMTARRFNEHTQRDYLRAQATERSLPLGPSSPLVRRPFSRPRASGALP
jgi:hypothetical protein